MRFPHAMSSRSNVGRCAKNGECEAHADFPVLGRDSSCVGQDRLVKDQTSFGQVGLRVAIHYSTSIVVAFNFACLDKQ